MKKICLIILYVAIFYSVHSQTISKIVIAGNGQIDHMAFGLEENVQVYLSRDGKITEWGFDKFIGYQENYRGELEPYVGRVEYYTANDDASLQGKLKYIGKILLNYYASYENDMLKGKLKSIGNLNLDYYLNYENESFRGLVKKIGTHTITWYSSFENEILRGKLKSVGPTELTYYGAFEDKSYRGKIKGIGRFILTYYSSLERYSGSVKTGAQLMNVNGIKYFARSY